MDRQNSCWANYDMTISWLPCLVFSHSDSVRKLKDILLYHPPSFFGARLSYFHAFWISIFPCFRDLRLKASPNPTVEIDTCIFYAWEYEGWESVFWWGPSCFKISKIQKLDLPKISRCHAHPKLFKHIRYFQKDVWFNKIYLCFNDFWGSQGFIKIPPSYFPCFIENDRDWRLFWTHQTITFKLIQTVWCPALSTFSRN